MALPCGHRRNPGQPEADGVGRVEAGRCPICPDPGTEDGTTRRLWRQDDTCRACYLSAGACGCCSYHWTVHESHARQVIAPVDHRSRP